MTELRSEAVSFAYGGEPVLVDVDFALRAGELTAIVGPNGSGKTTLLRLLAGLLKPDAGRVMLGPVDIRGCPRRRLARRIAFAPQSERPAWALTVFDMVTLGRVAHRGWLLPLTRRDREVVERALVATDLEALAGRLVTELSGGEFQRVVLARTLAQAPEVVLMDEPTAHLDLRYQVHLLGQLRDLVRERQLSAVVTLHDLNQAAAYADRIALLHGARILALGPPEEALTAEHLTRAYGVEVTVIRDPESGYFWIAPTAEIRRQPSTPLRPTVG